MIPSIGGEDSRWKKFDIKDFNTSKHQAHSDLNFHIRNRLIKMKAEYLEDEAKRKADKDKADKER